MQTIADNQAQIDAACRQHWDVIVVGGGHAGCEAAAAVTRLGARCLLLTQRRDRLGEMSCNPAMGGVGKGHLLREIDACDGIIARISDQAAIQYRLLNRSRGPAVQGPRAQIDRDLFRQAMQHELLQQQADCLTVLEDEVVALERRMRKGHDHCDSEITAVQGKSGALYPTRAVIITTGTFLNGCIFMGEKRIAAGRHGDPAATALARQIASWKLERGRLKTGTPARLYRSSIDWEAIPAQLADPDPVFLAFATSRQQQPAIACGITATNPEIHTLIRDNQHLSPVRPGIVDGTPVRYCPSIDEKVVRFAERDRHQIFLEPEGLEAELVYPNGLSTALPESIQTAIIRGLPGCNHARIARFGYAIEYDYLDPQQLTPDLQLRQIAGLFLAGQINGTTGYEEAAAQGLVAGLNAARYADGAEPVYFDRATSYIGVMIDDLISKGVTEPYRVFTSRAEYRLSLRFDHADIRLTPLAQQYGLLSSSAWKRFQNRQAIRDNWQTYFKSQPAPPDLFTPLPKSNGKISSSKIWQAFKRNDFAWSQLAKLIPALPSWVLSECQANAVYEGYVRRQQDEVAAFRKEEARLIPAEIEYARIPGLSNEVIERLSKHRPLNLGAAARLEGITAGAIIALLRYIKSQQQDSPTLSA